MWIDKNTVKPCTCVEDAKNRARLEASGLGEAIDTMTFENFQEKAPWQQHAKSLALSWVKEILGGGKPWMFFGGAVGSGKTHLCTAACGRLLQEHISVRYMLWPEESRALKSYANDGEAFASLAHPLQKAPVLYIDDLFKLQHRVDVNPRDHLRSVTAADVRLAFELLDARYRANLPTIISTEWMMDELLEVDEGVFSRVYQKSKGYVHMNDRNTARNMRLQAMK